MARRALVINHDICFNCGACSVACMQENDLLGYSWINVTTVGPRQVDGNILVDYVPQTCVHCARPPCADACPTKAIKKRDDGVVLIDESLCIGCLDCLSACPFGVVRLNPQKNVAEKCNMCLSRIDRGLKPACVHHCQAGAIFFGDPNEIAQSIMKQRIQRKIAKGD